MAAAVSHLIEEESQRNASLCCLDLIPVHGIMTRVTARILGRIVLMVAGLAVVTAGLTVVFLSMRAVMNVGGACGSGGPYVIAQPCPDGVAALLPLGIMGGLVGLFVYVIAGSGLPGPRLVYFAWSALFLSLGWNFWEFGLNPPGSDGIAWGWIVCGIAFVVMGGVPLLGLLNRDFRRYAFWAAVSQPRIGPVRSVPTPARMGAPPRGSVSSELARLADLHDSGALTDEEFQAAKRRVLE